MPRHYTDEEKRLVLDRLIANHGDVARTAAETGINDRSIHRWRNQFNPPLTTLTTLTTIPTNDSSLPSPVTMGEGLGLGVSAVLPPDTAEAFQELHDQLLPIAKILANRIIEAIDEAPLNQRMTALSQLIDRIAKLAALLPQPEEEIEYVHEYEYEVEGHVEKKEKAEDHNSSYQDQTED